MASGLISLGLGSPASVSLFLLAGLAPGDPVAAIDAVADVLMVCVADDITIRPFADDCAVIAPLDALLVQHL